MDLIELINQNILGKVDSKIDTLLSTLFFVGEKVIKVYKHKEAFYGNLSDKNFRKEFYLEDFTWNNTLCPDIYTRLVGVVLNDGSIKEVEFDVAEDFYIEMKIIDSSKNITNLLDKNSISSEQIKNLVSVMSQRIKILTENKKEKLKDLFSLKWIDLMSQDVEDLREWMYLAKSYISKEQVDEIVDFLKEKIISNEYFLNYDSKKLSVSIDNNCDNLLIIENKAEFIDIMPPKYEWRVCDDFFNISRVAVDCFVLGNSELYNTAYSVLGNEIPLSVKIIYELRSSLIQWPYRHIIGQNERAEKYKNFTLEKMNILKSL